jgi:hypothetical protein
MPCHFSRAGVSVTLLGSWNMMPYFVGLTARYRRAGRMLAALFLAGLSAAWLSAGLTADQAAAAKSQSPTVIRSRRTFHVEEATIADVHRAIQHGETICRAIVQSYIERARAPPAFGPLARERNTR